MQKACVIGWPIKHSRSPLIHRYWLKKYAISGDYEKYAVEPKDLEQFISRISDSEFKGCNITIPHKEQVFELVKIVDPLTLSIGAVNTVFMQDGMMYGLNTDGYGFISNLKSGCPDLQLKQKHCVVIGAGGASRAILAALLAEDVKAITLVNRTIEKAEKLAQFFGDKVHSAKLENLGEIISNADLLVNTTSLGMSGQPELNIDLTKLPSSCIVTDIVYTPLETDLLKQARQRGNRVVDGLGMLLHQAAPGFEKWFGVFPEVTQGLRDLIVADLDE